MASTEAPEHTCITIKYRKMVFGWKFQHGTNQTEITFSATTYITHLNIHSFVRCLIHFEGEWFFPVCIRPGHRLSTKSIQFYFYRFHTVESTCRIVRSSSDEFNDNTYSKLISGHLATHQHQIVK